MINIAIVLLVLILIISYLYYYLIGSNGIIEKYNKENKLFDRCFVINLKNTPTGEKRWKTIMAIPMINRFVERFPGIDGRKYNFSREITKKIVTKQWDYGRWKTGRSKLINMSKPEIGCILSHYYLWKKIVDDRIAISFVLEDDATKISDDFMTVLHQTLKHVPLDWDIILLGFWCHRNIKCRKINPYIYKVKDFALTHGYLINYKGAKKIFKLLPINMPIDSWLSSKTNKLNIYRHNQLMPNKSHPRPSGRILRQAGFGSVIIHTNNW